MPTCLELISVTNVIFNFQSQVGAIPVFSCKYLHAVRHVELHTNSEHDGKNLRWRGYKGLVGVGGVGNIGCRDLLV